jgi:hypothetical protein
MKSEPFIAFYTYNQKYKKKLEKLREKFSDDQLCQIVLDWIRVHLDSIPNFGETGYNDNDSIWACDAYNAWSENIDEDVIKYWPIPALEELLSK